MVILGGLIVVTGLWIAITGLLARSQLAVVQAEVTTLRSQLGSGDLPGARSTARAVEQHARRAHDLTTGPAWAAVAGLPAGGEPLRTVRALTAQVDDLGGVVVPQLVAAGRQLDPTTLREPDATIDLARISAATPGLDHALAAVTASTAAIAAQPAHTWLPSVDTARTSLLTQLRRLEQAVRSADLTSRIAPAMLGAHGVQHYFVAFQNEAEARGTGGIPGAFAILRADDGRLRFERFEPDDALPSQPTGLDFGPGYDQLFRGARTTAMYGNSNLSPNFPYAAQVWIAMWRRQTGEQLAGAIALDPTVLAELLAVTGPATLPDGTQVSSANVVALTESESYAKFPSDTAADNAKRKAYLLAIARAASDAVLATTASPTALVRAGAQAAGQRRLLVYSTNPTVESDLAQTSLSGAIPRTSAPYVGLSIVNDGGNKLDYYLGRSITWQRTGCGSARTVTVTITLTNRAPASGLSAYATHRGDPHTFRVSPGDNRLEVSYYGTRGGLLRAVDIDGTTATAYVGADLGHPVFTVDLELPHGRSRTIVLHLREPAGSGAPIVLHQPLVRPLRVRLEDATC